MRLQDLGDLQQQLCLKLGSDNIGKTELPPCLSSLNVGMTLRDYQRECLQYFVNYWEKFNEKEMPPHLLFHMATGSGKTLIMAGLMLYLYTKGYRNFLFFVSSNNILEKTRENLLNPSSAKYLFAPQITIDGRLVEVRCVDNFQNSDEGSINLCLTTTQGLHSMLNNPREGALTYDDFAGRSIVMISDEAHHVNVATKKGKGNSNCLPGPDDTETEDWENTVMRIFHSPQSSALPNVLLDFTATEDLANPLIAEKYKNKVIFNYPLKAFREDCYSKDIDVVQTDLPPMDRAMQAVVLSQYKRKLFTSIGQDVKPVLMMKSKTTAENREAHRQFIDTVKHLRTEDLESMRGRAKDDIAAAFRYFDSKGITLDNLLLELREDFKEENTMLVDSKAKKDLPPETVKALNSLEAADNPYRVIFAVDMLNEGWDVLNLFDIVRLYDTRDAKNGKAGKTTMQEAQLIGRGARYMPFKVRGSNMDAGKRKFDNDIGNPLRVVEKLHYHSAHNPRYIQELHDALVATGMEADNTKILDLRLKEEFKRTQLYLKGKVFANKRLEKPIDSIPASLGEAILSHTFRVKVMSGMMKSSAAFDDYKTDDNDTLHYRTIKMHELGKHVTRAAINKLENFRFLSLSPRLPHLTSIKEFIESGDYLADLSIAIAGHEKVLVELSQRDKLFVAVEVLKQIDKMLPQEWNLAYGSTDFEPQDLKSVFKDHILKITVDKDSDKEFGKSMREAAAGLAMDLGNYDWHAYNDCYGTSEEKWFIKYIDSIYSKLKDKYQNIYLLRNEKDLKLAGFQDGRLFEPDYVLFMQRDNDGDICDNIQIFIEPKGRHLRETDKWKEDCLRQIRGKACIHFSTATERFNVWGMPFFAKDQERDFDNAFKGALNV